VRIDDGTVKVDVVADAEPLVDIWGAERRTELFEKVFGMPLAIRWATVARGGRGKNGRAAREAAPERPRRRTDPD
jgi:hypothetical protein